jgi:hypothetical protein
VAQLTYAQPSSYCVQQRTRPAGVALGIFSLIMLLGAPLLVHFISAADPDDGPWANAVKRVLNGIFIVIICTAFGAGLVISIWLIARNTYTECRIEAGKLYLKSAADNAPRVFELGRIDEFRTRVTSHYDGPMTTDELVLSDGTVVALSDNVVGTTSAFRTALLDANPAIRETRVEENT